MKGPLPTRERVGASQWPQAVPLRAQQALPSQKQPEKLTFFSLVPALPQARR